MTIRYAAVTASPRVCPLPRHPETCVEPQRRSPAPCGNAVSVMARPPQRTQPAPADMMLITSRDPAGPAAFGRLILAAPTSPPSATGRRSGRHTVCRRRLRRCGQLDPTAHPPPAPSVTNRSLHSIGVRDSRLLRNLSHPQRAPARVGQKHGHGQRDSGFTSPREGRAMMATPCGPVAAISERAGTPTSIAVGEHWPAPPAGSHRAKISGVPDAPPAGCAAWGCGWRVRQVCRVARHHSPTVLTARHLSGSPLRCRARSEIWPLRAARPRARGPSAGAPATAVLASADGASTMHSEALTSGLAK